LLQSYLEDDILSIESQFDTQSLDQEVEVGHDQRVDHDGAIRDQQSELYRIQPQIELHMVKHVSQHGLVLTPDILNVVGDFVFQIVLAFFSSFLCLQSIFQAGIFFLAIRENRHVILHIFHEHILDRVFYHGEGPCPLLDLHQLGAENTFRGPPQSHVPEDQLKPVSDDCAAFRVHFLGKVASVSVAGVDERLYANIRSETFDVLRIAEHLKERAHLKNVFESIRRQRHDHFRDQNDHSILIRVVHVLRLEL